jgi:hypothetical protein
MISRRGSLQPAHSGYRYQDIATAYELVRALVELFREGDVSHLQYFPKGQVKVKGKEVIRCYSQADNG